MTSNSRAGQRLRALVGEAIIPPPAGRYARLSWTGDLLHSSGVVGRRNGQVLPGPLNTSDDVPLGEEAAVAAVLQIVRGIEHECGNLDRVIKVVSLNGFISTGAGFVDHVRVMDAASSWLQELFPGTDLPVRTTVGVASLPGGGAVEVSMVLQMALTPQAVQEAT